MERRMYTVMKAMRRPTGFVLGLLWLVMADVATAGSYILVVGKGIEVCEAYLKNLNSFPNHPPMVCERPLNPKFTDFSKPVWRDLEGLDHLDLLKQIWRSFDDLTVEQFEQSPLKDQWIASVWKPGATRGVAIRVVELDVDLDGVAESVLHYYEKGTCDPFNESQFATPYGSKFYILTPDRQSIDFEKTRLMLPAQAGRPDMFLYQGRVFASHWAGNLEFKDGQLGVMSEIYVAPGVPDYKICKYRYHASKKRR